MDLHMLSYVTMLPVGPCFVYAIKHQVYWGLTHNVVFYQYSDLIPHKKRHTAHAGLNRLRHPYEYIYILTPPAKCS